MTLPRRHLALLAATLFILLLVLASGLLFSAPLSVGVGYVPRPRQSCYQLDNTSAPLRCATMDFGADPSGIDPYSPPNFADSTIRTLYDRRYGQFTSCRSPETPGCEGHTLKRWKGPGNEKRWVVVAALAWFCRERPGDLGPASPPHNCLPTETETTDAQASNDSRLWLTYHAEVMDAGAPERAVKVCQPTRELGPFSVIDSGWGWRNYYLNECGAPPVVDPKPSDPPVKPCPDCICPAPVSLLPVPARIRETVKILGDLRGRTIFIGPGLSARITQLLNFFKDMGEYRPGVRSTGQLEIEVVD